MPSSDLVGFKLILPSGTNTCMVTLFVIEIFWICAGIHVLYCLHVLLHHVIIVSSNAQRVHCGMRINYGPTSSHTCKCIYYGLKILTKIINFDNVQLS